MREDIAAILRDTGTTAVLVTHDQGEALSLADSVAVLIDGAIAQHGTPDELYRRPAGLATARFVGATVELPGTAESGLVHTALGRLLARLPVPDGPAVAVLRPEQLRLGADGSGAAAQVTGCRFYGAETAVHLVLPDGTTVQVRSPGRPDAAHGATVTVVVAGDVLAYPSPTGGQRVALGEAGG